MVCQFYHTIYLSQIIIIHVSVIYLLQAFLICSHTHADIFAGFAFSIISHVFKSKLIDRFLLYKLHLVKKIFHHKMKYN